MTVLEIPTPDPRTFDETSRSFAEAVSVHYAIKKMIGRGGMGIVYLARDLRLDRLVALKTLLPTLATDPAVRERFLRETRAAGGMSHPNIVPIHGADEIDGHVFFVMGYVDGESLAAHVRARGRLDSRAVASYMRDVAAALAHAHGRGIIHRDIKAENILIERAGNRALVTDFGIARLAEAGPLTATGQLLGTVYYVSPEQVSGNSADPRSDLYSLGVVGYFALTGQFPFDAEVASAVLVAHVTQAPRPVRVANPEVPAALAAIIDRCLAKDPAHRFSGAQELFNALDTAFVEIQRPVTVARGQLVSDTEAHAVWQRAAELQALTGVQPRPDPIARPRDASKDRSRASGFSVADIRAAAGEAGIAEQYVEHALVEHSLTRRSAPAARVTAPPPLRRSFWAGSPLDIVMEAEVEGEIAPQHFDRIINALREGTATLGRNTSTSRVFGWRGTWPGHRLEVSLKPEDGRTKIHLAESIRRAAVASMVGSLAVGGVTGTLVGIAANLLMHVPAPVWGIRLRADAIAAIAAVIGVLTALGCLRAGRGIVRWIHERSSAHLQTLTELIALKARDATKDE